jgi:hypothetical protein
MPLTVRFLIVTALGLAPGLVIHFGLVERFRVARFVLNGRI